MGGRDAGDAGPRRQRGVMRRAALVLGTLAAALAGCGGDAAPERAPVASATPGATASPAQAATPAAPPTRAVRFRATDGRRVEGRFSEGRGRNAPAVVLLHEIRGGPDQWTPLLGSLHEAGFATLAYRSRPSIVESERLPDAIGALRWLRSRRGVDGSRLGMVGASIGASTTVLAMAGEGGRLARATSRCRRPTARTSGTCRDAGATARTTCCSSPISASPPAPRGCSRARAARARWSPSAPATASRCSPSPGCGGRCCDGFRRACDSGA